MHDLVAAIGLNVNSCSAEIPAMIKSLRTLAALLLALTVAASARADVATAVVFCSACHGAEGISALPMVPSIAGMSALVIENAIYDYRNGGRICPSTPGAATRQMLDMCAPARGVADADISGVAEHFASLPWKPIVQETDAAAADRGKALHDAECEVCHTDDGSNAGDDASILSGQHLEYLRLVMTEYAAGLRAQPGPMQAKMTRLTPDDIEALAQFYSSQH